MNDSVLADDRVIIGLIVFWALVVIVAIVLAVLLGQVLENPIPVYYSSDSASLSEICRHGSYVLDYNIMNSTNQLFVDNEIKQNQPYLYPIYPGLDPIDKTLSSTNPKIPLIMLCPTYDVGRLPVFFLSGNDSQ